jgi:hypothetical protein
MKRVDVFEQLNDGVTDKREIEEQLGGLATDGQ